MEPGAVDTKVSFFSPSGTLQGPLLAEALQPPLTPGAILKLLPVQFSAQVPSISHERVRLHRRKLYR
jgi:hypothetical protein